MNDREEVRKSDVEDPRSAEATLDERLRETATPSERRTLTQLARGVASLPADRARAVLEVGAQLAPVSLRACGEFLRAAPEAAQVLDAAELRAWGELGRRLANADTETGAQFFAAGVAPVPDAPPRARA